MKKLAPLFALFALLGLTSACTQGEKHGFYAVAPSGQTLYYTVTSSALPHTVSVTRPDTSYSDDTRPTGSLTIPSTVTYSGRTYSVTAIGDGTFEYCYGLTSVTIPNSVTAIGGKAFYDCEGLTSVTIPNSVTAIGGKAFVNCRGLTSVTIPNSVTTIGDDAFSGCKNLTSLTIPNSVTSIGYEAFSGCSGLTSLTIPNSVTSSI